MRHVIAHVLPLLIVSLLILAPHSLRADEHIQLNPAGEKLPFDHQGPFVSVGNGKILAVGSSEAYVTDDRGKTWSSYPLFSDNDKYQARNERALIRTRKGTVVFAWMNERERDYGAKWGKGGEAEIEKMILPVYVSRGFDGGQTWTEPQQIQKRWCGAVRSMIQLDSGRLVLVAQKAIPWRHVTLTYVSDDDGATWQASELIDIESASGGDHSGTMEGTVVELSDGRVYMLIRTTRGWLWEAYSSDGGLTWNNLRNSEIRSSTCCATLCRLASGRIALLWNRPPADEPKNIHSRAELSIAFSDDEAETWTRPVVVSRRPLQPGEKYYRARQSYPYIFEPEPGVLWITTMQGGLRMKIVEADLVDQGTSPRPDPERVVVAFGDSTTATRRELANVYADLLRQQLAQEGIDAQVFNEGVGGNNTEDAIKRFQSDVLDHDPDIVIMQFGINDSTVDVWKRPSATEPRVPVDKYGKNLETMVQQLKKAGAKVILMTPNPLTWSEKVVQLYGPGPGNVRNPEATSPYDVDDPMGFNKLRDPYLKVVRDLAAEQDVVLVDIHKKFLDYAAQEGKELDELLLDGMHPNEAGHRLVAQALVPVVLEQVGKGQTD